MPIPIIDKTKCSLCNTCVDICPVEVFEKSDSEVKILKPEECIGCRACEAQCPESCIIIKD